MLELSIYFTSEEKDESSPITVRLFRPDTGVWTDPVPYSTPITDRQLGEIRWYLEDYASWPTGPDHERAERLRTDLERWGRNMLSSVVASPDSARLWQQFVDSPGARLLTIDSIEPRVLRLPWEILADEGGHIFTQGISIRRRLRKTTTSQQKQLSLPVRVLVIVSRPDDAGFMDPRSETLPMLNTLDSLGGQVETEFLYPPTLTTLSERLHDPAAPEVHIIHFDGHGKYETGPGLGYLLFEDDRHKSDAVDALQLGNMLNQCGVPLMVLNACQSAQQGESNPFATVAARLIRSGVGSVLAMNYSILVTAASKFVEALYGGLARGQSVGQALDAARRRLYSDQKRGALTRRDSRGRLVEETITLRDWFLPALYQQALDPVIFPPSQAGPSLERSEAPTALTDPSVPGGLPPEPLHGFHGRARELLDLERLLAEKPVVVLWGFGGLGKTALAAEAGRWLYRTGRFPGGAAFISFEQGGSLQQLCSWVGQAISGDPNFVLEGGDAVSRITDLLAKKPSLIILDNFESVLGAKPLMPVEELKEVLDAVWTWSGAGKPPRAGSRQQSRILITTRELTFTDARFKPSRNCAYLELGGLSRAESLALAAAVLDDFGIDRSLIDRDALTALMDRLGGHPLSLNLALPQLKSHSPAELSARFEELLPGFTTGAAKGRNESLEVSLEFSLRRLGDATRQALPALSIFQGVCFEDDMLDITQIDPELWAQARAELEAAALVSINQVPQVKPPFLRFHPTLLPYLSRSLPAEQRAGLQERYWKRYYAVSNYLYNADSDDPHHARIIAALDFPNLSYALDLAIAAGAVEQAVDFADSLSRFLDNFGRRREMALLIAKISQLQSSSGDKLSRSAYLVGSQQGDALMSQGRSREAETHFRRLLERLENEAGFDARYEIALTQRDVGLALQNQGRNDEAAEFLKKAIQAFTDFGEDEKSARLMISVCKADLGNVYIQLGHYDPAQQIYEEALEISREQNNLRQMGVVLSSMGTLNLARGKIEDARKAYEEALQTFRSLGEPESESVIWHQLGRAAQEAGELEEAERCFRESLKIDEALNNLPGMATASNQLGLITEAAGRAAEAEQWYLRGMELFSRTGQQAQAGTIANNLADLYLKQGKLDEAEKYARQALSFKQQLDISSRPWTTYAVLARINEERARQHPDQSEQYLAEAASWRRQEQQAYAAFGGSSEIMQQWDDSIDYIVQASLYGSEPEKQELLKTMRETLSMEYWSHLIETVARILDGERDEDVLCSHLDRVDAMIVRATLQRIAARPPQLADEERLTPEQAQAAFSQAEIQKHMEKWEPVIQAVAVACQGDDEARQELEGLWEELKENEDWKLLVAALRLVLQGERRSEVLFQGLDDIDRAIVDAALRRIAGETPPAYTSQMSPAPPETSAAPATIEDHLEKWRPVIEAVVAAVEGDQEARQALDNFIAEGQESQDWGQMLRRLQWILNGERNPDVLLNGLDAIDTAIIQVALQSIASPQAAQVGSGAAAARLPAAPPASQAVIDAADAELDDSINYFDAPASYPAPPDTAGAAFQDDDDSINYFDAPAAGGMAQPDYGAADDETGGGNYFDTDTTNPDPFAEMSGAAAGAAPAGDEPDESGEISLPELIALVEQAIQPGADPRLAQQIYSMAGFMASNPAFPSETRQLARVLQAILSGDHNPDLSGLPRHLAAQVRSIL